MQRKNRAAYASILKDARVEPSAFTMVGDLVVQDVLSVLSLGASAVHVPQAGGPCCARWKESCRAGVFALARASPRPADLVNA